MKSLLSGVALISVISVLGYASAQAQEAPAAPEAGAESVPEIVVTGSRVVRQGFDAPTPTTVLGADRLEQRPASNIGQVLNEIPSFAPTGTPTSFTIGSFDNNAGSYFLDLRGLGAVRTLTLVDRKRFVPSTESGVVNMNLIPTGLIERVEVVTGGASAQWGSDAVSGVVNVILKDKIDGIIGGTSYQISSEGDNREFSANLATGTTFADGRGRILIGGEYVKNDGADIAYKARSWARNEYFFLDLPNNRPAGQPAHLLVPDVHFSGLTAPSGVIVGGPLHGTLFLPGGGSRPFVDGNIVSGIVQQGGDNDGSNLFSANQLANGYTRQIGLLKGEYDVTDGITAFTTISYGRNVGHGTFPRKLDFASIEVSVNNSFLVNQYPEVRQALLAADPTATTFTLGRVSDDVGPGQYRGVTKTWNAVAGLRGEFGDGWHWDISAQRGENRLNRKISNVVNLSNWRVAIDDCNPNSTLNLGSAVVAPSPGCVPFNLFGAGASPEAIAYVTGTPTSRQKNSQDVFAANLSGDPFSTWAGPVSVAIGGEYRREKIRAVVDSVSAAGGYDFANPAPLFGKNNVKEAYFEAVVPLLKDSPLGQSLEFQGAVRYADYKLGGSTTTWKLGGTYQPIPDIRFRVTRSRDFRAPNLFELFKNVSIADLVRTPGGTIFVPVSQTGNPNLKPEKSYTTTAGVVLEPRFLPGLRLSADYYDIKVDDVITSLGAQRIVDRCNAGATEICNLITRAPSGGQILSINDTNLNLNQLKSRGWDFEAVYRVPLNWGDNSLTLGAFGNHTQKLTTVDTGGAINRAGQDIPRWSWNLSATLDVGRVSLNANVRTLGHGVINAEYVGPDSPGYDPSLPNSINVNRIRPFQYLNFTGTVDVIKSGEQSLQFYLSVNNVFDTDPPPSAQVNGATAPYYDQLGRMFRIGLRFKH